jgi:hypothetical protein
MTSHVLRQRLRFRIHVHNECFEKFCERVEADSYVGTPPRFTTMKVLRITLKKNLSAPIRKNTASPLQSPVI